MFLPGFGKELGEAVIARRTDRGPFESLGALFDVRGFSVDVFRKAEKFITVRSATFSVHAVAAAGEPRAFSAVDAVILREAFDSRLIYFMERSL